MLSLVLMLSTHFFLSVFSYYRLTLPCMINASVNHPKNTLSSFPSFVLDDPDEGNQQTEEIETADAHQISLTHLQKEQEFHKYKDLYLEEILPNMMKEDELRKTVEDISSSGEGRRMDGVAFDLERLERCRFIVNSEVQSIESSLNWANTRSLWSAVKEFKVKLQNMGKLLEQGILGIT